MLSRISLFFIASFVLSIVVCGAAETRPALPAAEVAVLCEAVVVAHVGSISNGPAADGGSLAFWVDRVLKGRLAGGRDIIWIPRKEVPKTIQQDGKLWLLFLSSLGDGSWHIQTGGNDAIESVESVNSSKLAEISKAVGSYGPRQEPEGPVDAELVTLVKKAARGSQEARSDAKQKLLAGGEGVRNYLSSLTTSDEHETATLARTLLPLFNGGAAVKDLRLSLEPLALAMTPGDMRNITVNFANLSSDDMRIVTGQSAWGENVMAAASYEIRAVSSSAKDEDGEKKPAAKTAASPLLPAILPADYGKARTEGGSPLPIVGSAPAMGMLPIAVAIELEKIAVDGKELRRLKFPHGHVVLPGPGKYALRVRFACPGPRPDQQRLIDAHYWGGGQLVSNEIILLVK